MLNIHYIHLIISLQHYVNVTFTLCYVEVPLGTLYRITMHIHM